MTAVAELVPVDPFTDRDAWLDWRRGGIGASDIAGVLGISRWSSPWRVWAEKVGLLGGQQATNAMKAGIYLEDGIRRWYADETGLHVEKAGAAMQSLRSPLLRCTGDGEVYNPATGALLGGLEIKNEGPGSAWTAVPDQYQAQGQWQMAVAGWDRVHFAVLHGRNPDFGCVLERDDRDIEFMVERAEEFWADHVAAGVPPDIDGSEATARALAEVYPGHVPGDRVDISELVDVVAEWRAAADARREAEAAEKAAKNRLLAEIADAELGTVDDVPVVSCRKQTRHDIDRERLRQDHPDLYREYETTTEFRVLRLASKKDKEQS